MCECGCAELSPICWFRGPGKLKYVVQVYPGCEGCGSPAGIIIYAFTPDDIDEWCVEELPEREILYEGTAFPVIDTEVLKKRMEEMYGEYSDEAFACTEGVDNCFKDAVWDNIKEGRKILKTDQANSVVIPKLLKWARRAAHINRRKAERALRYTPDRGVLRKKEKGDLPVAICEILPMAKLYQRPSAAFYLRRVPFRWYIEALGWPRKKVDGGK